MITDKPLARRVAVVTGGSSGIGWSIALALGAAGAAVVAVGRDVERLRKLAKEADASGSQVETVRCELTDDGAVRHLAHQLSAESRNVDIVVHAAGVIAFGAVRGASLDDLDRMILTNVRGPYVLTQALLPLLERRGGHVVFVNSSAAIRPTAGVAAYGATKHALRGLADALRDEVNPLGIRVTSIYPGRTRTRLQDSVLQWEGRDPQPDALLDPTGIATIVVAVLALPGSAEVTDIHIRPMGRFTAGAPSTRRQSRTNAMAPQSPRP